jgi:murein DD-endopeptidase MepM/ murein hydrolase activator NlpD
VLETRQYIAEVYIEDNLTNAIRDAGEGDGLTDRLTENIFGSVIDFRTHPRKGDRIRVLFEKKYLEGRFIRYGSVLVADYAGQIVQQMAFHYTPPGGNGGYYDGEGKSLARMFLLYPLQFRGINSHFNRRRFHPVLKRPVPHLGTDYAASRGEPVHTTAIGTITHAGRKGSYGLLVEVEHPKGYRTRYAHLSKITVKKGQRVAQRQSIGRVGTTGRSTGPHLHYEIIKNGRHINPTSVNRGERGKSLDKKHLAQFRTHRDSLLDQLNAYQQRAALAAQTEN